VKSQQAVPYPDLAGWVNAARLSGGKTAASMLWAELQALLPEDSVQEDFIYLFTSSNISNCGILIPF